MTKMKESKWKKGKRRQIKKMIERKGEENNNEWRKIEKGKYIKNIKNKIIEFPDGEL